MGALLPNGAALLRLSTWWHFALTLHALLIRPLIRALMVVIATLTLHVINTNAQIK